MEIPIAMVKMQINTKDNFIAQLDPSNAGNFCYTTYGTMFASSTYQRIYKSIASLWTRI